jgi:hypothetical protein
VARVQAKREVSALLTLIDEVDMLACGQLSEVERRHLSLRVDRAVHETAVAVRRFGDSL